MTQLVGILNITPDSFSDGGQYNDLERAVIHAEKMLTDGAVFIDVGAESTRPNATRLTHEEEWVRLAPVLADLLEKYPSRLSLDTYHPETAEKALDMGSIIINDVTGMNNQAMLTVVSDRGATCIVSHLAGTDVHAVHDQPLIDDINQIREDLLLRAAMLESKGVFREDIILDPGIGFGKTPELNQKLLRFAEHVPDYQVMIGYSRKRFLGDKRMDLETNLAAGRQAIESGAAYLRVHDVAGHQQLLSIY